MDSSIIIKADNLVKLYRRGSEEVRALDNVSLDIKKGEFVSFTGPSGSGKTTLINILGCLDNPTSGKLAVGGEEIFSGKGTPMRETAMTLVRRKYFGYIFQYFYLLPTLTVYENTILPFTFFKKEVKKEEVMQLLSDLGMQARASHFPSQLSGGEMQRVAIARALVNRPAVLLADEPTGNLDHKRSMEIGALLKELNSSKKLTIIMVTHNDELARMAGRHVALLDGSLS